MARKEFTAAIKRAAWARCGGRCEGTLATGIRCNAVLDGKRKDFDHINPDGLTGQPTLENCAVLCELCHLEKTAKIDIPAIARAKRRSDAHLGISTSSKPLQSGQSLPGANPARRASRPLEKPLPPRRGLYTSKASR